MMTEKWSMLDTTEEKIEWLKAQIDNFIACYNQNVERTNGEINQLKEQIQEMKQKDRTPA